ncbi:hypothetical protein AB6T38_02730 [Aliiglaciecola sp. SL4]|uniref:hypothetical protein n=1 Tax=Aliiglaciecola sp. SL4 TaxID=3239806 RepID=UPI00355BDF15
MDENDTSERLLPNVLQFYGVGGVGKSRLLKELKDILPSLHKDIICSKIDFDDDSINESSRALLRLRNSFDKKVQFKLFDFAYAVFFGKRNPEFEFSDQKLPLIEEAGVLGSIISVMDGLGIVGAISGIVAQTHKYSKKLLLDQEAKLALQSLQNMSEKEIVSVLPEFFSFDLNSYCEKKSSKAVLFFDTYEALWYGYSGEKHAFTRDSWVRQLANSSQYILIVIAGREKLRWQEYNNEWESAIDTHLLNNLSKEDVVRFLNSAGIKDKELVEKIASVSGGHPYYLDLCLDILAQNGAVEITEWPDSKRELFDRFSKSLSSNELALLKRLAPLSSYDDRYTKSAVRHFNIALNDDELHAHRRFSFVKLHEDGSATLHDLMRRSLLSHTPDITLVDIRTFAFRHFEQRLAEVTSSSLDHDVITPFNICVRQLSELKDKKFIVEWLNSSGLGAVKILQKRAIANSLLNGLKLIKDFVPNDQWPIEVQVAFADLMHLTGEYVESVRLLDDLINSSANFDLDNDKIAMAKVRKLHHSMMFKSIDLVWSECELLAEKGSCDNYKDAHCELLFLIGGNLGATRGIKQDAMPWLIKALIASYKVNSLELRLRIYRKVSDFHRLENRLEKSRCYLEKALSISEKLHTKRYTNYIECTLADQLRMEKSYGEAIEMTEKVRFKFASQNLDGWLGHTYLVDAATYIDSKERDLAINSLNKANRCYLKTDQLWGRLQVELMKVKFCTVFDEELDVDGLALFKSLTDAGYVNDVKNLQKLKEGDYHPSTALALL